MPVRRVSGPVMNIHLLTGRISGPIRKYTDADGNEFYLATSRNQEYHPGDAYPADYDFIEVK